MPGSVFYADNSTAIRWFGGPISEIYPELQHALVRLAQRSTIEAELFSYPVQTGHVAAGASHGSALCVLIAPSVVGGKHCNVMLHCARRGGVCAAQAPGQPGLPIPPPQQPESPPPLPATAMPGPPPSHPATAAQPPLQAIGVDPDPLHDPAFQPWPAAGAAAGPSHAAAGAPPPGAPGARTRAAAQTESVLGGSWDGSQELPYKAARLQTKTERQQMLNKAAQQRCGPRR